VGRDVFGQWRIRHRQNLTIGLHATCAKYAKFFRLFELEPAAKVIFGFKEEDSPSKLAKMERFSKHAQYFIQMIDKALGMLGPDIELLTDVLMDLGLKHVKVSPR